ncbi:DUF2796 domain-containing protein [Ideonella oryzae]|uniref:DUF2796 domain-containing protein n=1 Tax=Ideonella oryzae TaxID=2937441 RepID=A0ABT1BQX4_9BURK|nr:DUF2796 domain-containing protein [Ideonella oryzae]MCO5977932.1 DUF2796 domain-containing protein [Ideonella oryzae]
MQAKLRAAVLRPLSIVCLGLVGLGAQAHEPGAHVHGAAVLRVVVDGNTLNAELESPLDNILGYEHAPGTPQEQQAVKLAVAALRKPGGILQPTPAAQCTLQKVSLASAALTPAMLGGAGPATPPSPNEPAGHADLDGDFSWQCAKPEFLHSLRVDLFLAFPRLHKMQVEVAGPKGQSAATLTESHRTVQW